MCGDGYELSCLYGWVRVVMCGMGVSYDMWGRV